MRKMENENIELITRDPKKAILKLSIPIFITLIISFIYHLIDTFKHVIFEITTIFVIIM